MSFTHLPLHSRHCVCVAFPHKHWNAIFSVSSRVCPPPFCNACTRLSTPFLMLSNITQSDPCLHLEILLTSPPMLESDTCNSVCILSWTCKHATGCYGAEYYLGSWSARLCSVLSRRLSLARRTQWRKVDGHPA